MKAAGENAAPALVALTLSLLLTACSAATSSPGESLDDDGGAEPPPSSVDGGNDPQGASPDTSTDRSSDPLSPLSPAGRDGGADAPPLASPDGPPVPPPPPGPRDPGIFTTLGIQLGPKGNSPCELAPLKIPEFTTQNEGPGVVKVCAQGCPYAKISAALTAAPAGSVIAVQAGTYTECLTIAKNNITLQGRGGRPIIQGTGCSAGVIAIGGTGVKVENLELPGGDVRLSKGGLEVTYTNLYIHDASKIGVHINGGSTATIENCYFQRLGFVDSSAGRAHYFPSVWAAYDAKSLTIRNSIFVRPNAQAWLIHSRGHLNVIECTVAANLDAVGAQPIFFRGTGALNETIQNSVLQIGPVGPLNGNNPNMITYWTEYRTTVVPGDGLTIRGNIFLWDYPTGRSAIDMHESTKVPLVVENNLFVGTSSIIDKGFTIGANNRQLASRAAAGIEAVPLVPYPGSGGQ